MDSFVNVPKLWSYERAGSVGKNVYPVTVTVNVKHPQYRAINCPNQFKSMLTSFLELKKYKYHVNGVLEYHKLDGKLRSGGLHMHGFVYCRNPPRDNKDNLFHFYIQAPDSVKGIRGYVKYSKKSLTETEKRFKQECRKPLDVELFNDSPTIEFTKECLFED